MNSPDQSVVYLDNAATSWPKPPEVGAAMVDFLRRDAANPGRGAHRMALRAGAVIDQLRVKLARLVNAEASERIVLTNSCSHGLNIAIHGAIRHALEARADSARKPRVITTVLEHNSIARPLELYERRGAIELVRIGCDEHGFVPADWVLDEADENTVLVAMLHVSNVLGTIQPIGDIGAGLCERAPGALFLVDAAQSIGVLPVDVRAMSIDLLAFPGHKAMLGPTGTGALYVGPQAYDSGAGIARIETLLQGGTGGDSSSAVMPPELPHHFEAGTPNTVGYAGLSAAIDQLEPARTLAHERRLVSMILDHVRDHPRFRIVGPLEVERRVGVVSLRIEGMDVHDAAAALDASFGIAVRPGLHCAPMCHRAMGTFPEGTLRVSPGVTSTEDDVSRFLRAIESIMNGP